MLFVPAHYFVRCDNQLTAGLREATQLVDNSGSHPASSSFWSSSKGCRGGSQTWLFRKMWPGHCWLFTVTSQNIPFPGGRVTVLFGVHSHSKTKTTGETWQRCCCSQPPVFFQVDEIFSLWVKCLKKQSEVEEKLQISSPWLTGLLCRLFQELCDLRIWLPLALPLN